MMLHRLYIIGILSVFCYSGIHAQIASFNFSATPVAVSGWTNLSGNPAAAVVTATSNGITVSSIAAANWSPNGVSARNGNGFNPGTYFPAAVMSNNWFQYNGSARTLANYNASVPQLQISGLNPDSFYILKMTGSDTSSLVSNPMDYTISGSIVYAAQGVNAHNNATQGVTFQNIYPNSSGIVKIYVNTTSSTDIAPICGLQVWSGTSTVGIPVVTFTSPANNAVFAQGSNVLLAATATETGGTIAKMQFYYGTTFIGEVDTPPYNFTWVDPAAGSYNLAVKATDNAGTITVVKTNITVEPATNYWSTLGNTGNSGSTNFLGNVDSVRLGFRTDNLERMSISPTGTVMVGTANVEDSLSLHGTLTLVDTSLNQAPMNLYCNNAYSPFINLYNTNSGAGASIGLRYYNNSGLVAQFFSGSSNDAFTPNGYAFHQIGPGGMEFVAAQPTSYFSWGNNFKISGGTEMIFYPNTGHLIIGSTKDSGNNKLQINGNTWTTGLTIPTGATAGYVLTSDSSGNATWHPGSGGRWLYANGTVYDSADNIDIGTSNPQGYKLAVNGTAIFTKIVVKPEALWPDYVFDKAYRLPSIEDLRKYIDRYKHLPGVTDAAQADSVGIDVAATQSVLLKKLEELTLYMIRQNAAIEELKRSNRLLQKKIQILEKRK